MNVNKKEVRIFSLTVMILEGQISSIWKDSQQRFELFTALISMSSLDHEVSLSHDMKE